MPPRLTILHSIDTTANRFRFFVLEIRELGGGRHELVRRWGRIGTDGREAVDLVGDPADVAAAFDRLLERRVRRGYRIVDGAEPAAANAPGPERELGSLVAWEARLFDALVRTRKRLAAIRKGLRPTPASSRLVRRVEQLDLFAAAPRPMEDC